MSDNEEVKTNKKSVDLAARTESATKIYGKGETAVTAIKNISIDFPKGKFTAIMGPSGSGKSTLMHVLAGLDSATSGKVFIGDTEVTKLKDKQLTKLRRTKVGFIFQAFNLVPTLTAIENIELPSKLAKRSIEPEWKDQVIEAVKLGDRLDHKPSELSGGQQQRVAVARALVTKPDIIFADEPTGNLDSVTGSEILEFMQEAVEKLKQTIVMVTHDANAAAQANNVTFLADGEIVAHMDNPTTDSILNKIIEIGR